MARTSKDHPLRIATLDVGQGRIGITLCPGKKQNDAQTGQWNRDLETDLNAVVNWGADALVTLIEDHEMMALQVNDLGIRAESSGLEWHHLPIGDRKPPDARFESRWIYSGNLIRRRLRDGGAVVIHCMGGLGRAGTIGARLLVEFGCEPLEAIERIRAVRPGAIETIGQERHVGKCRLIAASQDQQVGRKLGCLIGGALGDAFGYLVEFDKREDILSKFGPSGLTFASIGSKPLIASDDTQMTLFTAEALGRARQAGHLSDTQKTIFEIRRSYLDWVGTQGHDVEPIAGQLAHAKEMRARRAPGNTCLESLKAGGFGTMECPRNSSKGCGGVIRVAPIGLIDELAPNEVFALAARSAAITHGHPSAYLSAGTFAAMIRLMLAGEEPHSAVSGSLVILKDYPEHEETWSAVRTAITAAEGGTNAGHQAVRSLGEGWTGQEALAIGVYSLLSTNSFEEAIVLAANHDGDSDSTASIAGQLAGLHYPLESLPHAMVQRLDLLDPLLDTAGRLLEVL